MHVLELAEFNEVSIHYKLFEDGMVMPHELRKMCDLAGHMRQQGHLQVKSMNGGWPLLPHVLLEHVASPWDLGQCHANTIESLE